MFERFFFVCVCFVGFVGLGLCVLVYVSISMRVQLLVNLSECMSVCMCVNSV